jgi:biotin carboxylase
VSGAKTAGGRAPASPVLVANRGEIAIRVMRACREMGWRARHPSGATATALYVMAADLALRVGPLAASASYLNVDAILELRAGPAPTPSIPATASCRRTPASPAVRRLA